MATLLLCNRISGKGKRIKIDGVNLKEEVKVLRNKIASMLEIAECEIELIYCGRILKDSKELEHYDVKPGVTLHALRKKEQTAPQKPERLSDGEVKQVVSALQTALINPAYRATVEKMLNDTDTLANLMAATPGLDQDPVAIAMLQDPELLAMLADPSHVQSVIEAHPVLGQAAMLVATAVNKEGTSSATGRSGNARGTYSLDQMSDDEDMDSVRPAGGQAITANQLAAALMAAGSGMSAGPSGSAASSSSSSSTGSRGAAITADFFQQAMQQASGGSQESQIQSQLAQLRDMGITDEAVARQALEATGGDLQAALEMLFGDGMQ